MAQSVRPRVCVHLFVFAVFLSWRPNFVPTRSPRVARAAETQTKGAKSEKSNSARSTADFEEVKPGSSGEGMKRARQFLALEPLDDEVNQWEADMKARQGTSGRPQFSCLIGWRRLDG
ncbi:unnamed protein product [Durusdinium trenchii]|uniref:Uncharacterized protein n=1 Tax=Durusdinium trenchii TaxID=1381693 RepID=A0ABP0LJV3_9DINO